MSSFNNLNFIWVIWQYLVHIINCHHSHCTRIVYAWKVIGILLNFTAYAVIITSQYLLMENSHRRMVIRVTISSPVLRDILNWIMHSHINQNMIDLIFSTALRRNPRVLVDIFPRKTSTLNHKVIGNCKIQLKCNSETVIVLCIMRTMITYCWPETIFPPDFPVKIP